MRALERLTGKNNHAIDTLRLVTSVCDRSFGKLMIFTRVDYDTRQAELFVRVRRICCLAPAHIDSQLLRKNFSRRGKRRLVCNKQQGATAAHPITDNFTLGYSKRGTSGAFVIRVLAAKWIYNHENLMTGERGFGERLAINRNVIAIVKEQFAERLVTIVGCIKVVVGFIEQYARPQSVAAE